MIVRVDPVKMVECVQTKSTTSHVDVMLGLLGNDVKLVSRKVDQDVYLK